MLVSSLCPSLSVCLSCSRLRLAGKIQRIPGTGFSIHMKQVAKTRRRLMIHRANNIIQADQLGTSD
eukprot:SAG22_NODE_2176_length_2884_cov_1.337882_6_plen_65_part_01